VRLLKVANQQLHREMEDLRTTITRLQGTSAASEGGYTPPQRQSFYLIGTTAQKRLRRDKVADVEVKATRQDNANQPSDQLHLQIIEHRTPKNY